MPDPQQTLAQRFAAALTKAFGASAASADPLIRPSGNPQFGDYQANVAMSLAKTLGRKPREVAQELLAAAELNDVCEKTDIAGPGFINLRLRETFLGEQATALAGDPRLGVPRVEPAETVVVDYGGPNVAKEMHVGHLRSSVIGDAIVRVLEFQGHRVIRQNHVGDWGTQFGMIIEQLLDRGGEAALRSSPGDLTALYQEAKRRFDAEPAFADRARGRVVKLQSGDAETMRLWHALVDISQVHFQEVFGLLGVSLSPGDTRGESFYNPMLRGVVEDLDKAGLLRESEGAAVVFPEGFTGPEGKPVPLIVRKTDGGYLYATTDLAAACYRVRELRADRLIYVTDSRQNDRFAMLLWTLRKSGWAPARVRIEHVPFGTVLGADRKPFKTRSGDLVSLKDLLEEAQERAANVVREKNPSLGDEERAAIARVVGVGAVKYADLANDRVKDYVFDWDRMLSFEGNTAPYLQYAYVRTRSIFRKGGLKPDDVRGKPVRVREPAERQLALKLLQLPGVIDGVAQSLEPHRLGTYLYELATTFHQFFEHCPVLTAEDQATRDSRLVLCELTARALALGLGLLGIGVVEQM